MNGQAGYAVFFFPQALEALGAAIKPYLQDSPAGPHVPCDEVDTAGAFIEMTLRGKTAEGKDVTLELMVPSNMVLMIVSSQQDGGFGFRPHRMEATTTTETVPGEGSVAPGAGGAAQH